MSELLPVQNYHPQANLQSFFGIAYGTDRIFPWGDVARAESSFGVVVTDTTATLDFSQYWRQILHFQSLPKIESPKLPEYLLTQFGIYHATSLVHILDESVNYPSVKNRIMSILEPYIQATEELDFDTLPISSTGVIGSVVDDETAQPKVTDVRNTSFFRFLDELEAGAYAADDMKDEE